MPATRRNYTNVFRAPQWHGATQTHFPPRPRKSAWHCDITDVIRHTVCPHTGSNPITRYRQSSHSPATRRVYTSMFRAPQWHGATQTHFPPRPRKSAWHCDITDVISPHGLPTHISLKTNTSESSSATLFPVLHLSYKLATSESRSKKLFPVLHLARSESNSEKLFPVLNLYCKLTSKSNSQKLFPALHLRYKLTRSKSSSTSEAPSLQNERFVQDFLQK